MGVPCTENARLQMNLSSSYEWTLNYRGRVETKWSERLSFCFWKATWTPPLRGLPWSRLHICPLVADPEAGGTDSWVWLINGIGYAMVREFILETELRHQQGLVWGVLDIPANLPSGSPLCGTAVSSRFNGERNLKGYLQPHLASPSMAFPCSFAQMIA
ncbi:hypothetical protein KL940_000646 [Ogataea angusta]|uniref:Uncharacterized protein n=1 Tax=Pichia angusta TaxID=870730 RepID=A0ABQ7S1T3_PICAN|nr:hypothetical protein KL940_000646 [Ogataea angusta]